MGAVKPMKAWVLAGDCIAWGFGMYRTKAQAKAAIKFKWQRPLRVEIREVKRKAKP